MVLPIYVYGQQVLREIAKPVDPNMEGLDTLLSDMYETMKNADGVGIAAPQVGKSLRVVIVDGTDIAEDYPELKDFKRYMINPEILEESEETSEYSEGCLSVPDINCNVIRPSKIKVRYINEKRQEVTEEFSGFGCRMVQHELDHLDGHLFVDRFSQIRRKLIGGKLRKLETRNFRPRYKIK
ncbi:MAG: peptide deformylase [Bacteroidales bacterium]|nr:peptide deformylase [Bacteroidales bacterium]